MPLDVMPVAPAAPPRTDAAMPPVAAPDDSFARLLEDDDAPIRPDGPKKPAADRRSTAKADAPSTRPGGDKRPVKSAPDADAKTPPEAAETRADASEDTKAEAELAEEDGQTSKPALATTEDLALAAPVAPEQPVAPVLIQAVAATTPGLVPSQQVLPEAAPSQDAQPDILLADADATMTAPTGGQTPPDAPAPGVDTRAPNTAVSVQIADAGEPAPFTPPPPKVAASPEAPPLVSGGETPDTPDTDALPAKADAPAPQVKTVELGAAAAASARPVDASPAPAATPAPIEPPPPIPETAAAPDVATTALAGAEAQAASGPPPEAGKSDRATRASLKPAAPVAAAASAVRGDVAVNAQALASDPEPIAEATLPAIAAADPDAQAQAGAETPPPLPDIEAAPEGQPQILTTQGGGAASAQATAGPQATAGTMGSLATQIVRKMEARTSRFEIELDPMGLGKVNVTVEINPRGQITAALAFERPQSAAELGARSGELRAALEKAGFDVASGGLSFQSGNGGAPGREQQDGSAWTANAGGRAFDTATRTAEQAQANVHWPSARAAAGGLDIRI